MFLFYYNYRFLFSIRVFLINGTMVRISLIPPTCSRYRPRSFFVPFCTIARSAVVLFQQVSGAGLFAPTIQAAVPYPVQTSRAGRGAVGISSTPRLPDRRKPRPGLAGASPGHSTQNRRGQASPASLNTKRKRERESGSMQPGTPGGHTRADPARGG